MNKLQKSLLFLVVLLLMFVLPVFSPAAFAQSALSNFNVTGSAVGFSGVAGAQTAVLSGVNYNIASRVSVGFWDLNVPGLATYNFGVGQYALPLSSLLGKKISSKLNFDASAVNVAFDGGIGKVNQAAESRVAGIFGGSVSFPITPNLTFNAVQAYYVKGGLNGTSGGVITPALSNFASIGMGMTVSLDSKGASFKHLLTNKARAAVRLNHCAECQ